VNTGILFLPGLVVSAENQGTFSDYHVYQQEVNLLVGQPWVAGSGSGIYSRGAFYDSSYHEWVSSRLSKN